MSQIIGIVSGSGGAGKTALCARIAVALARRGYRVLCIDCEVSKGCLDLQLGMGQEMALSFLDLCRGDYTLEQIAAHPQIPNLALLSAPVTALPGEPAEEAFADLLRRCAERFDFVLLDGGCLGSPGFSLAAHANRCILVTGYDGTALRTAYRAGQTLELLGITDVRLIVNRVHRKALQLLDVNIDDVMDAAGLPLLGVVPEDPQVPLAAAGKTAVLENKAAGEACQRITMRILGKSVPVSIR